jgi:DNA-binding NarL/FixJ family response regulator
VDTEEAKKTVLIVEGQPVMREGLKSMLLADDRFSSPITTGSPAEAIRWVSEQEPDLVIVDPELPGMNGRELSRALLSVRPGIPILMVDGEAQYQRISAAFKAGVRGYSVKESSLNVLMYGVSRVLRGECFLDGYATASVVQHMMKQEPSVGESDDFRYASLTFREKQVLQLLAAGFPHGEVADRLKISVKTVSNHRTNLMRKLDVRSYPQMVRYALHLGIVDPALWQPEQG